MSLSFLDTTIINVCLWEDGRSDEISYAMDYDDNNPYEGRAVVSLNVTHKKS